MKTPEQPADVFIDLRRRQARADGHTTASEAAFQVVRQGRPRRRILIDPKIFSLDGAFAFVLSSAMLFVQQAGSLSGLAMAVLPLIYMLVRRRQARGILRTYWPLLALPAFALLSVLWSESPPLSAKYGTEMWLTAAAGIGLATAHRPTAVIKGLCLGFLVYMGLSWAHGGTMAIGVDGGGDAFVGLGDGKNVFADIATTGSLLSLASMVIGIRQRKPIWAVIGLVAAVSEIYLMTEARSAGAVVATAVGVVLLFGMLLLTLTPRVVRSGFLAIVLASVGILIVAVGNITQLVMNSAELLFNKDPTLTGRTYLWYRAHDIIAEKPWLGRGYYTFWRDGNTDAEGLWQYAGVRGGFNFHNALVELSVQLGYVGAAIFCIVAAIILIGLIRQFLVRPSITLCFWFTYFLCCMVRAPTEAVGYAPFYYSTCLLFAAGAVSLAPIPRMARSLRRYVPQALRLQAYYTSVKARSEAGAMPAE